MTGFIVDGRTADAVERGLYDGRAFEVHGGLAGEPDVRAVQHAPQDQGGRCDHDPGSTLPATELGPSQVLMFISGSLIGEPVDAAETDLGDRILRFRGVDLGIIDRKAQPKQLPILPVFGVTHQRVAQRGIPP
ncbi:hypothetical protein LJ725_11400 [Reyranella aquatilis]|uniref:Uncharacterized protein n=1 Tax=Reyranella aquatilis TaxID=2035356 RepID=A0ABS8KU37_9HYPH|nr:hypothetical protein [Reyranella aquatilis]MCC8429575.1 hypothetical protein [Reyranella aquatilis]